MAGDYGGMPTRYGAMFGTPKRVAETLTKMCGTGVLACERDKRHGGGTCPLKNLCDGIGTIVPATNVVADWLRGGYMDEEVRVSLGH